MNRAVTALFGLMLCLSAFAFGSGRASAAELDGDVSIQVGPRHVDVEPRVEVRPKHVEYEYRDYCVRQYFKCRHFTESGWEFRHCMRDNGCWDAYLSL